MENIPTHIGFIIDGNRRWAKAKGLPTFAGHLAGIKRVREIAKYCQKRGIKFITFYGFSTENWKRSRKEVNYLFKLFERFARKYFDELKQLGIKVRHLGVFDDLPDSLVDVVKKAIAESKDNTKMIVNIAVNYGGRDEILRAIAQISKFLPRQQAGKSQISKLTEGEFSKLLDTEGLPDPDLIIRTSGEQRLSGFLPWQAAYSELYFTPVHWPDFSPEELDKALDWYANRERRFGK